MNRSSSQRHGGDSSRGGSRRGQQRTDFGAPQQQQGGDGWNTVSAAPPRNPGKVGDLAHFGKIEKRTPSGPQTFGPSTVFGRNKGAKSIETPPMSRVNSNSNMFSLLNQDGSSGADASSPASSEPAPQRKRLVLKPRTKPVDGEEGEEKEEGEGEEEEEEEGEEEEETSEEPSMPKEEADRLIKTRVAEFYNVKVRSYFFFISLFSISFFSSKRMKLTLSVRRSFLFHRTSPRPSFNSRSSLPSTSRTTSRSSSPTLSTPRSPSSTLPFSSSLRLLRSLLFPPTTSRLGSSFSLFPFPFLRSLHFR